MKDSPVVAILRQIQKEKGLTDAGMAILIGCSRQLYQMTRTGKIKAGGKVLTYLLDDSLATLSGNATQPAPGRHSGVAPGQRDKRYGRKRTMRVTKPQDKNLGG